MYSNGWMEGWVGGRMNESSTPMLTVGTLMRPTTISLFSRTIVWNLTMDASSGTGS